MVFYVLIIFWLFLFRFYSHNTVTNQYIMVYYVLISFRLSSLSIWFEQYCSIPINHGLLCIDHLSPLYLLTFALIILTHTNTSWYNMYWSTCDYPCLEFTLTILTHNYNSLYSIYWSPFDYPCLELTLTKLTHTHKSWYNILKGSVNTILSDVTITLLKAE